MTDTEQSLLDSVCRYPADDLPRLIYAEYIEEHGQPERAEFIRLQIGGQLESKENNEPSGIECEYGFTGPNYRWSDVLPGGLKGFVVSRGFPSSISCTLERFMGGECRVCSGGRVRMFEMINPEISYRDREILCTHCTDGYVPGLVETLGRRWPITSVTLTDREPTYHENLNMWEWNGELDDNAELPIELYERLQHYKRQYHVVMTTYDYSTRAAAMSALSDAAVDYARDRAGLPPLNRVTRPASAK